VPYVVTLGIYISILYKFPIAFLSTRERSPSPLYALCDEGEGRQGKWSFKEVKSMETTTTKKRKQNQEEESVL
jgi:hypothetical protein